MAKKRSSRLSRVISGLPYTRKLLLDALNTGVIFGSWKVSQNFKDIADLVAEINPRRGEERGTSDLVNKLNGLFGEHPLQISFTLEGTDSPKAELIPRHEPKLISNLADAVLIGALIGALEEKDLEKLKRCEWCRRFFFKRTQRDRFCPGTDHRIRAFKDNPEEKKKHAAYQRQWRETSRILDLGLISKTTNKRKDGK